MASEHVLQELQQLKRVQEGDLTQQKFIAIGGYGMVFSAALHGQRVAVKVMMQPCNAGDGSAEEQAPDVLVDFFAMEMSIASQLRHPHLIKVLGFALLSDTWVRASVPKVKRSILKKLKPGGLYLAALQELAKMSVHDAIMRSILNPFKRQYRRAEAWSWLKQIVRALVHLHTRDICVIHRDMKAANVLLCPAADGKFRVAKICDFGMVSVIGDGGQKLRVRDIIRLTAADYDRHITEPKPPATPGAHRLSSQGPTRWSSRNSVAPSPGPFALPDAALAASRPADEVNRVTRLSAASIAPSLGIGQLTLSQRSVPASLHGPADGSRASAIMSDMSERRRLRKLSICVGAAGEEVELHAAQALMLGHGSMLAAKGGQLSLPHVGPAGAAPASPHLLLESLESSPDGVEAGGHATAAEGLTEQQGAAFAAPAHSARSHQADFPNRSGENAARSVHDGAQCTMPSSAYAECAAASCDRKSGTDCTPEDEHGACRAGAPVSTSVRMGEQFGGDGMRGGACTSALGLAAPPGVGDDNDAKPPTSHSAQGPLSRTVGLSFADRGVASEDGATEVARKLSGRLASSLGAAVAQSAASVSSSVAAASDVRNSKLLPLTGHAGTLMYMAPEIYKDADYNASCDVFSFALVAWELLFMTFVAMEMADCYSTTDMVERIVFRNWRPPLPHTWPAKLKTLLSRCWDAEPLKRPTGAKILKALEEIEAEHADWIADKGCACIF